MRCLRPSSLCPVTCRAGRSRFASCSSRLRWAPRFSQLLIALEREGQCAGNTGANQYFVYVLDGAASILIETRKHRLEPGSYVYLPSGQDVQIASGAPATRLLVFQKEYQPLPGVAKPAGFASHERDVRGQPLRGNDDARLQALLPDSPAFDIAVNLV